MLRVKVAAVCAFWVVLALVFFPRWLGVTVAVLVGVFGLGVAALGAAVVIDPAAGVVSLRLGLLFKRVRLADITAVIVDKAKLSLRYARGWEFSSTPGIMAASTRCSGSRRGGRHRARDLGGSDRRRKPRRRGRRAHLMDSARRQSSTRLRLGYRLRRRRRRAVGRGFPARPRALAQPGADRHRRHHGPGSWRHGPVRAAGLAVPAARGAARASRVSRDNLGRRTPDGCGAGRVTIPSAPLMDSRD